MAVWWAIAFWTGVAGVILALPAFITGFIDLLAVPAALRGLVIAHLSLMGALVMTFLVSLLALHGWGAMPQAAHPLAALVTDALAALFLLLGGWLGGHLVYAHGVGVRAGASADTETAS